jgi:hypothetical protein
MRIPRTLAKIAVASTALVFSLAAMTPANAVGETPSNVRGTGSDVAWRVMTALDSLYNLSPGCNLLASGTQPLDQSCQADFAGFQSETTENYAHDVISEYAPIGGTAGTNQLCGQSTTGQGGPSVAPVDYARQTKAPSATTCTGTHFVAYARDGLAYQVFPAVTGSATASFSNSSGTCAGSTGICLTQNQLKGIFVSCTITNWNQVGGANAPIEIYVPLPQFGTRSAWDGFLGGDTSTCIPAGDKATHIIPAETDDEFIAPADLKNAIVAVSVGSWNARYKAKDGSKLGKVDNVAPTTKTLQLGTYPYARFIYNVYCAAGCPGGASSAATVRFVGEQGWICKATTHTTVSYSTVNYRTAITKAITSSGFVPLTNGPIGGGASGSDYCRLTVH